MLRNILLLVLLVAVAGQSCPNAAYSNYDPEQSRLFFQFSVAAFSADPNVCLNGTTFCVVHKSELSCNLLDAKDTCSGYVAVSHIEKKILLAYRGSWNNTQMALEGFSMLLLPERPHVIGGNVVGYWSVAHGILWSDFGPQVRRTVEANPRYSIWITGHSMGAAFAVLGAVEVVSNLTHAHTQVITFGEPRLGSYEFAQAYDRLVPNTWRVVHASDPIPHMPPCQHTASGCAEIDPSPFHHGIEVFYPDEEMNGDSRYKICCSEPFGEDPNCSNAVSPESLTEAMSNYHDHRYYYGVYTWQLGVDSCDPYRSLDPIV